MEEKSPLWQVLKRHTVHESKWLSLYQDWVQLPDGSIIEGHHVVEYPRPAVAIVGVNSNNEIILIDHHRFIVNKRGWEVPGGGMDSGETPEETARRELLEESGCTGGEFTYLGEVHPSIGSTNQTFIYFLAKGIEQTEPIHDTNEVIGTGWFSIGQVRQMIERNQIYDGFSLTALLLAFYKGYLA